MIDRDLVEMLVAAALIAASAATAIRTALPRERTQRRPPHARPEPTTPPIPSPGPPEAPVAVAPTVPGVRARPRILTGEPIEAEPHRPATRRALKLVVGITVLAAGGAVGLLVLVRALVTMFKNI